MGKIGNTVHFSGFMRFYQVLGYANAWHNNQGGNEKSGSRFVGFFVFSPNFYQFTPISGAGKKICQNNSYSNLPLSQSLVSGKKKFEV